MSKGTIEISKLSKFILKNIADYGQTQYACLLQSIRKPEPTTHKKLSMKLTFLHTADIHLGNTYRTSSGETERDEDFFRLSGDTVTEHEGHSAEIEKSLQTLIEKDLETLSALKLDRRCIQCSSL